MLKKIDKLIKKAIRRRLVPWIKEGHVKLNSLRGFLIRDIFFRRFKTAKISAVKTWCQEKQWFFSVIPQEREVQIAEPQFFDNSSLGIPLAFGKAQLPEAYVAEIHNAVVIGGSDLVLTNNMALYDELALYEKGRYGLKSAVTKNFSNDKILLDFVKEKRQLPKKAIHFCKDHSYNYFHWMIECLPRLWMVNQFPQYDGLPLLIDKGVKQQYLDALNILNVQQRELIFLEKKGAYPIEQLIYPSGLSVLHDNYDFPVAYDKDVLISPVAIKYLREHLLPKQPKVWRKIYISRKNIQRGKYLPSRTLINATEIESWFVKQGFQIVYPELLSFEAQVHLFSEAEIIAGPPGAGMTNILFAPEACKILMLNFKHERMNYYLFSILADCLKMDLRYVLGEPVVFDKDYWLNCDFRVEVAQLEKALAQY